MLNRVEAVIRCYDPCLSCSTHALGEMALHLQLIGPGRNGAGRAHAVMPAILVVGYGNALRTDDGIGWHAAERLMEDPRLDGVDVLRLHQLAPELALDFSRADLVVLIDASRDLAAGTFTFDPVPRTNAGVPTWSHHISPGSLIEMADELYGHVPEVYVVSVGVALVDAGEALSPELAAALPRVVDAVAGFVAERTAGVSAYPAVVPSHA